jgi:DNA-binding FadR family transcriptional regulator
MHPNSHEGVLNVVGRQIVEGQRPPGAVVTLEQLQTEFSVSRTVVREAMRVLESMSLVESRRRVGLIVRPRSEWSVFDPRIVRWRLAGSERETQLRWLTELRVAVEPWAATQAAHHANAMQGAQLRKIAADMRALGEAGNLDEFLTADIEFHTSLMRASGNEMFGALSTVIAEVLSGRTNLGLMPHQPTEVALDLHEAVAEAVAAGDAKRAQTEMSELLSEVRTALFGAQSMPAPIPTSL